ncbi:MAG TPA: alpha/beta hydrolase [Spirillospora sp.]|nr:alpha/beta hydrolase [Spirillospora sp.]
MVRPPTDAAQAGWPPPPYLPPPPPVAVPGPVISPEPGSPLTGARRYDGVTYATSPGYRPRLLDLWVPETASGAGPGRAVPLVVWIHGGGWLDGDRRYPPPTVPAELLFGSILNRGMAVATVDYRHSLEAPFPAQLHDVKAAIRYLHRFRAELGIDTRRIGLWGESAGGHLAALAGLTAGSGDHEGTEGVRGESGTIAAVVDWYGVSDLRPLLSRPLPPGLEDLPDPFTSLLGGADPASADAASPVTYAGPSAPPFLLVHGTGDRVVPFSQSERLAALLDDAELVPVEGADHVFMGSSDIAGIVAGGAAFLARHLKAG